MVKNLKLSQKLWSLTFFLLLAVLLSAGSSLWLIKGIFSAGEDSVRCAESNTFMVKKEVDHLEWLKKVQDLFVGNHATLDVQLDHTKCGLGKFLHGEEGEALARSDTKLAALLEAIKGPHKHVHDSGRHIKDVWQQVHPGLSRSLAARLDEHRCWAASVSESLLNNKEINVQLDPAKCAFGKWLAGDECHTLVNEWPEFGGIISKVIDHHNKLHESAATIKTADTKEKKKRIYGEITLPELQEIEHSFKKAQGLEDARVQSQKKAQEIYRIITIPELNEINKLFAEAIHLEGMRDNAQEKAHSIFAEELIPALKITQEKMKILSEELSGIMELSKKKMYSTGSTASRIAFIITIASFIIGIFIGFFLIRSITRPINRVIESLNEGADQVASASGQVSSSSQRLASGASEQSSSIEETSSSLEEMSSMTKQNAENAHQANILIKETNQVVDKANETMKNLTTSMEETSKASEETSKIIKTIDEIAFQTNLLALNAAVEAARAGEAGAGFAVVADEVRNLAMRAADAAKNTSGLIETTVKRIKDGSDLVVKTNEAFNNVAKSTQKVSELVADIAGASNKQAKGIDEINKAVVEIEKVVQQNSANAEESAGASEEMNAQARQMKNIVGELGAIIGKNERGASTSIRHKNKILPSSTKARDKEAAQREKKVSPSQIIPMDGEYFTDF